MCVFCIYSVSLVMSTPVHYSQGVFIPALLSSVEPNSGSFCPLVRFVCVSVNTVIELGCGPKQLGRDLCEEVVSVSLQTCSGMVRLFYKPKSILIHSSFRKNCTFLDKTSSCSQLCCALWAQDDFVNNQQLAATQT